MFDFDKLNTNVEKASLHQTIYEHNEMIPSEIGSVLRTEDTKEAIAFVTDTYEVVQFRDIAEQVSSALEQSNIDLSGVKTETIVSDNNAKMELVARFPAHKRSINSRGISNDLITPEFRFRTSHDRKWANSGMMGYFRHMCYNTLVDGNKLAYVYGRHTKNFSFPTFAAKISAAAEYVSEDGFRKMEKWYSSPVSRESAINLFSRTLAKRTDNVSRENKPNKVMLSNLMKTFDEENRHILGRGAYEKYATRDNGTLWTAYQAATSWSTHTKNMNVKPLREAKVVKMLASSEWGQLELAA